MRGRSLDILRAVRSLTQLRRSGALDVRRIDTEGILVGGNKERLVDVSFDGRRIWSFWLPRDGEEQDGALLLRWPKPLRPYLDGVTRLTLTDPGTGAELFAETLRLGDSVERIAVVNPAGRPLALDKSLKLVETFDSRDAAHVEPLLDAIEEVLGALHQAGVPAFLA